MRDLAIVFPGQGTQYIGMGKEFYDNFGYVKEVYEEASDALQMDLKQLVFQGEEEILKDTRNAQAAILTVSYASYQVFQKEIGLMPSLVAGHSLGEITALIAAGAIDFYNGVKIVRKRGELMGNAMPGNNGGMAAVSKIDEELLRQICGELSNETDGICISNYNSRKQLVISGDKMLVEKAVEKIKKQGGKASLLKVSTAFHSPYMLEAGQSFGEELKKYQFNPLQTRVLSNVTADFYKDSSDIIPLLTKQIYSPVRWTEIMNKIQNECGQAIEMSPKNVLTNMLKGDKSDFRMCKFEKKGDLKPCIQQMLPNSKILSRDDFFERLIAIAVCTQNSNFDNQQYEQGVTIPYRELQTLNNQYKDTNNSILVQDMKQGIDRLKLIFDTKGTEVALQKERFQRLMLETETQEELSVYVETKFQ